MVEPNAPIVLVAGAPRVGKTTLVQALTRSETTSTSGAVSWSIDTKYYRTRVDVREAPNCGAAASTSCQPEALILVFSLRDPGTLSTAQGIARGFDLEQVEVKLLCGTHADALAGEGGQELETSTQPSWFQGAIDWSVEHGFEFIACCPAASTADAALTLDGDQQGVARVTEALHAHAWPNLVLLPRGEPYGTSAASASGAAPGGQHSDGTAAVCTLPPPGAAAAERTPEAAESAVAAMVEPPMAQQQQQHPQQGHQPSRVELGDDGPAKEDATPERVMEGLERLMEEMRGHKSKLASLSDEERREQAAAMALRMLEVLGLEGSGSGDDDDNA